MTRKQATGTARERPIRFGEKWCRVNNGYAVWVEGVTEELGWVQLLNVTRTRIGMPADYFLQHYAKAAP